MSLRRERRDHLFDLLMDAPEGITIDECCEAMRCDRSSWFQARRDLLEWLTETDDTVTVVVIDQPSKPSLYKLGSLIDEAKPHLKERLDDLETRLRTQSHTVAPLVAASDGRTSDGKRARYIRKYLTRMREDLDELLDAEGLW